MVANRSSEAEQAPGPMPTTVQLKPQIVAPFVAPLRQNPPLSARVRLPELFRLIPRK
jgi:hypothetical protein